MYYPNNVNSFRKCYINNQSIINAYVKEIVQFSIDEKSLNLIAESCRVRAEQKLFASLQISNAFGSVQINVDQTINRFVMLWKTGYALFQVFDARLVDRLKFAVAERCVGAL